MLYEEHASLHMVLYFNQRRINQLEAKIEGLQWNVIQPVKDLLVPLQCLVQFIVGHVAHELPQDEAKYQ